MAYQQLLNPIGYAGKAALQQCEKLIPKMRKMKCGDIAYWTSVVSDEYAKPIKTLLQMENNEGKRGAVYFHGTAKKRLAGKGNGTGPGLTKTSITAWAHPVKREHTSPEPEPKIRRVVIDD